MIPRLPTGNFYQQVSAGGIVTAALRSDGCALVCGGPFGTERSLAGFQLFSAPRPQSYIQVAAGYDHVVLLKQNGIYILETMNTGRLAEENVHEFMFVLGQARLKGAVQMIINPVAMW